MSFIGTTEEINILTNGKTYKIFITAQDGGYWVATTLYVEKGTITTRNMIDSDKNNVYKNACNWVTNNIDKNAVIDPLKDI